MSRAPNVGNEHDDEIERLYVKEKLSMSAIARKFGIQVMTVKRKLMKRGVEIRGIATAMTIHHLKKKRDNVEGSSNKVTGDLQHSKEDDDDDWLDNDWV